MKAWLYQLQQKDHTFCYEYVKQVWYAITNKYSISFVTWWIIKFKAQQPLNRLNPSKWLPVLRLEAKEKKTNPDMQLGNYCWARRSKQAAELRIFFSSSLADSAFRLFPRVD